VRRLLIQVSKTGIVKGEKGEQVGDGTRDELSLTVVPEGMKTQFGERIREGRRAAEETKGNGFPRQITSNKKKARENFSKKKKKGGLPALKKKGLAP